MRGACCVAAAAEIIRRARLRGLGEDESVPVHGGRAALRRDEVQTEAEGGAGRGRRNRRYAVPPHAARSDYGLSAIDTAVLRPMPKSEQTSAAVSC